MTSPISTDDQRFQQLIDASCNQRLGVEEMAELDAALRGNPERLRTYRDLCRLHTDLHLIVNSRIALDAICSQLESRLGPGGQSATPQSECGISLALENGSPQSLFDPASCATDSHTNSAFSLAAD